MTDAETVRRAWFVFWFGLVFVALTALQIWTGKTIKHGGGIVLRKKEPKSFWYGVVLSGALALFCLGLALSKIVRLPQ